jgi:N-acetyl sugar amidotransferase
MTLAGTCKRCLYTEAHPLGLTLDEHGVCSGCRIHEEKDTLDWGDRWGELERLVKPYRSVDGSNYDCIVPVTGANYSYFILYLVKEKLKLNPLLVTYNKYFNTPLGIRNLANLRIRFDCDLLTQNVNPESVKKITRATLYQFGSMYWPCLAGHTAFPVQTAVRFRIPLIIWGAHQGLEQVGMFSHQHNVEMTRRYRCDHDLLGREADDLLSLFDTVSEADIWQYRYPPDDELARVGVRGIYLGNYVRWDPKSQHQLMIDRYGYQGARFERSFDTYDHVDCWNYMGIHDYIKLVKHGYSRVTDQACREIRHGRITRNQGIAMINRYSRVFPSGVDLFCDWLGVDMKSLHFVIDRHRNNDFWEEIEPGNWRASFEYRPAGAERGVESVGSDFHAHASLDYGQKRRYVVIGKGFGA